MEVSALSDPDDVVLLHDALMAISKAQEPCHLHLKNCGTAMRFLTAYCAMREGLEVTLDGVERMRERPIGQLVDALHLLGADITYLGEVGYPPLRIVGRRLVIDSRPILTDVQSTQFVSALLLCGVEVQTNSHSPYIAMTRRVIADYPSVAARPVERCYSSAAFWYEYVALHGGTLLLKDLRPSSLQGDKVVMDLFRHLGVETRFTTEGAEISKVSEPTISTHEPWQVSFADCPDLYPAVALTCERLGIRLEADGVESLRLKESDRLAAVAEHQVRGDHRMAMALLCADYPVDESDRSCIAKSYPTFLSFFVHRSSFIVQRSTFNVHQSPILSHVTPRRGINDDGLGKKHALRKLISQSHAEYVWLHDDDVVLPPATDAEAIEAIGQADLLILPLRMNCPQEQVWGIGAFQALEYALLQELTLWSCELGHPVMCSGANMIVRREAWLESADLLHPELPSGDDMFLLEAFKQQGRTITCSRDPRLVAEVRPVAGWRSFFRQRMRWAGKAPAYRDRDIVLSGVLVTLVCVLQLLCPAILLLTWPLTYYLVHRHRTRMRDVCVGKKLLVRTFLLAFLYPYYALISLIGGLFRRKKW